MITWGIFVLAIAFILIVGIERLIARLGVERQDPRSAPRGLAEIAERLRAWAEERNERERRH